MAGIYLHIPFCRQACHYCNFHFSTSLNRKNDFVTALLKEMERRKEYIAEPVETIYFGGGTPSLLDQGELDRIMEGLHRHFAIAPGAEITLEANPDDIVPEPASVNSIASAQNPGAPAHDPDAPAEKLRAWRQAGINRLSIGVQSFFEEDLRWMNRAHGADQALASLRLAQEQGFENISIDLIYGGPTLPDERWEQNVGQAIRLGIPHLSCYALTVEPATALDKMIKGKKLQAVDPDAQARQFLLLMDWLANAGYDHYEISNFSLPGKRSRHNSSYWKGLTYLGLGPSAHSFDGVSRQWNVANNGRYIDSLFSGGGGGPLFEKEELSPIQQLNEYIMISLRTIEGCDLALVGQRFGEGFAHDLRKKAERHIQRGTIKILGERSDDKEAGARLALTREGKLLADGIAADLFF
jgi:oxygen-independent coproporphyrinogen-3 oxidase